MTKTPAQTLRSAGRPRFGARRQSEAQLRTDALLRTAERSFLEHGYEETSLDRIVAQAGGSKATLRKYFGDKAGLFAAVVERASGRRIASFHIDTGGTSPKDWLQRFGTRVLAFYLDPRSMRIYRTVIAIGHRDASPARAFYDRGHKAFVALLAAQLRHWAAAGLVSGGHEDADADRFLHLLRAGPYERALLGLARAPGPAVLRTHARACVRLYLDGMLVR